MRIILHRAGPVELVAKTRTKVRLEPGVNEVQASKWAQFTEHSITVWYIEQGIIEVQEQAPKVGDGPLPPMHPLPKADLPVASPTQRRSRRKQTSRATASAPRSASPKRGRRRNR